MLHVALWQPEIPPNTGNIARLCAATGATLHLIGKLGFQMDDRSLKRAGIDYWPSVILQLHAGWEDFHAAIVAPRPDRLFCLSAHAARPYTSACFEKGDILLFGNESSGLPAHILEKNRERALTIPMLTGNVRSLNLATAVGIVAYEALRQLQIW